MKKYFILIFCSALSINLFAQNVLTLKNGASLTLTNGASMTIFGGISSDSTGSVINNGTLNIQNNTVANEANWVDLSSGGILTGNGSVVFESSFTQAVSGKTQFHNLEINNNGLELPDNTLSVQNKLILKNGKIGDANDLISISNSAADAIEAGSGNADFSKSYIPGSLERYFANNTDTYIFPVGGNAQPNPLHFVNKNLAGYTKLTAQFSEPRPGTNAGINVSEAGIFYDAVLPEGVWYLNAAGAGSGGAYDLELYFNGFSGLFDNQFAILRRPNASVDAADWVVPVGSVLPDNGSPGRLVANGYARRNNLTTFSQFGIGTTSAPLPLTLLTFNGVREKNYHLLSWETTDEVNTDKFILERSSTPGSGYLPIADVKAKGNLGLKSTYMAIDASPLFGDNFYRLKMYDMDATFNYSGTIRLRNETEESFSVYPNPVISENLQVSYVASDKGQAVLQLNDISGKVILQRTVSFTNGLNRYEVSLHNLAKGTYQISLWAEDRKVKSISFINQ
jgi:hypothetical protein